MTSALQFWYRPPRVLRYLYKNRKRWKYPSVLKIRPQHLMWLKRIFINHKAKILDFLYSYVLGKSKLVCPSFIFSECLYLVQKCNISLCCKAAIFFFFWGLYKQSHPLPWAIQKLQPWTKWWKWVCVSGCVPTCVLVGGCGNRKFEFTLPQSRGSEGRSHCGITSYFRKKGVGTNPADRKWVMMNAHCGCVPGRLSPKTRSPSSWEPSHGHATDLKALIYLACSWIRHHINKPGGFWLFCFVFPILYMSSHCPLAFMVSDEKSVFNFIENPLYTMIFFLLSMSFLGSSPTPHKFTMRCLSIRSLSIYPS